MLTHTKDPVVVMQGNGDEIGGAATYYRLPSGMWIVVDWGMVPQNKLQTGSAVSRYDTETNVATIFDDTGDGAFPSVPSEVDLERVEFIFVTHAHTDHIAALPKAYQVFPNLRRIYMTQVTHRTAAELLWESTIAISKDNNDGVPIYDENDVEQTENLISYLEVGDGPLGLSGFTVEAIPAGHIPGAVSFFFTLNDGRTIFDSGDISFQDQQIVRGMPSIPDHIRNVDFVHMEATNVGRETVSRADQIEKLLTLVTATYIRRRCSLIPVFTIARGPEIYSILREAGIQAFVDGSARKSIELCSEIIPGFEFDKHDFVKNGRNGNKDELRLGRIPSVVITPAGMLMTQSNSWRYAWERFPNSRDSIIFSGYQAPSSPGGVIQNTQKGAKIVYYRHSTTLNCAIESVQLSSHAYFDEIRSLLNRLNPAAVLWNHAGDREAMRRYVAEESAPWTSRIARAGEQITF